MQKIDYYIPGCPGGMAGLENLLVSGGLYANQVRLDFDKTSGSHKLIHIPADAILEALIVKNSVAFNGSVKLGNTVDNDAYIVADDFPVGAGIHDPVALGIPIGQVTTVTLTTSGNTAGKGTAWLLWRPLI